MVPNSFTPLSQSFYAPSARLVASKLLGHWLLRATPEGFCGGPIIETEAYLADDPASHGYLRQTPRNRVMYGPPGFAYVYFIYGNHSCVNAVCQSEGVAEAVLIRAVQPEFGLQILRHNRVVTEEVNLTSGPGKLCAAMAIDRKLDGVCLFEPDSPIIIAENPNLRQFRRQHGPVIQTTRIGITRAADLQLRFYLDGSRYVSRRAAVR